MHILTKTFNTTAELNEYNTLMALKFQEFSQERLMKHGHSHPGIFLRTQGYNKHYLELILCPNTEQDESYCDMRESLNEFTELFSSIIPAIPHHKLTFAHMFCTTMGDCAHLLIEDMEIAEQIVNAIHSIDEQFMDKFTEILENHSTWICSECDEEECIC